MKISSQFDTAKILAHLVSYKGYCNPSMRSGVPTVDQESSESMEQNKFFRQACITALTLCLLLIAWIPCSCTTPPLRSQLVANLDIEKPRLNFMPRYVLDQTLSQAFYLKMVEVEVKNGFSSDNKYTHANSGLILCALNPTTKAYGCLLYGFLADRAMPTFISPLEQEEADAIFDHYTAMQSSKGANDPIYMDLFCSYFGKNNPPFGVQEAICYLDNYRSPKQVYLTKAAAQELMSKLPNNHTADDGSQIAGGTVICGWHGDLNRMFCQVQKAAENKTEPANTSLSSSCTYYLTRQFSLKVMSESEIKSPTPASSVAKSEKSAFTLKISCSFAADDQEYFCAGTSVDAT